MGKSHSARLRESFSVSILLTDEISVKIIVITSCAQCARRMRGGRRLARDHKIDNFQDNSEESIPARRGPLPTEKAAVFPENADSASGPSLLVLTKSTTTFAIELGQPQVVPLTIIEDKTLLLI